MAEPPGTGRTTKTGTFLVTAADPESAVLADVSDRQVHTLDGNPGLERDTVLEATLATRPPMHVVWTLEAVESTWDIEVVVSDERPTQTSLEAASNLDAGEVAERERAGDGVIHLIAVPPEATAQAIEDVEDDSETRFRAARLGARQVEIRSEPGLVAVRYLP
ncbi:MAG: DUF5812 family protein [Halodesulfurarchaeum sp.]